MECRICFDSGSEPLISPCKCTGSMKWVHKTCLQTWVNHKKDYKCPVCKEKFVIERNKLEGLITYILDSDTITTIITILICICILNYSIYYKIRPNTIALSFFILIFGMHYIQKLFGHEEINFDVLFETMLIHHTNNLSLGVNQYGHFSTICAGMWIIVDKGKHVILTPYT
jgi:hypothetical protein